MKKLLCILLLGLLACNSNISRTSLNSVNSITVDGVKWMNSNLQVEASLKNKVQYFTYAEASIACPLGWELPDVNQWNDLIQTLNQTNDELDKFVQSYNGIKMNDTTYSFKGKVAYFWAQSDVPHIYFYKGIGDTLLRFSSFDEHYAVAVRCVKK